MSPRGSRARSPPWCGRASASCSRGPPRRAISSFASLRSWRRSTPSPASPPRSKSTTSPRAPRATDPGAQRREKERSAMPSPLYRPRRLRELPLLRKMVRETHLKVDDFVYPLFVAHGRGVREPIGSMPGQSRLSVDELLKECKDAASMGIPAVLLFGLPAEKDPRGSEAYAEDGIIQQAVRAVKDTIPDLLVITDVCLCEYTSHGHCGVVEDGRVKNDPTLDLLARTALSHVEAGADLVAPSDMMDG